MGCAIGREICHERNGIRMQRIAAIGRLRDLIQVLGIGAVVHYAIVQGGASGLGGGPANDRRGVSRGFQLRVCSALKSRGAEDLRASGKR